MDVINNQLDEMCVVTIDALYFNKNNEAENATETWYFSANSVAKKKNPAARLALDIHPLSDAGRNFITDGCSKAPILATKLSLLGERIREELAKPGGFGEGLLHYDLWECVDGIAGLEDLPLEDLSMRFLPETIKVYEIKAVLRDSSILGFDPKDLKL